MKLEYKLACQCFEDKILMGDRCIFSNSQMNGTIESSYLVFGIRLARMFFCFNPQYKAQVLCELEDSL